MSSSFERPKIEKEPEINAEQKPEFEKRGKIVCAWCGKEIGEKEGAGGTTHGICQEYYEKEMKKLKKK